MWSLAMAWLQINFSFIARVKDVTGTSYQFVDEIVCQYHLFLAKSQTPLPRHDEKRVKANFY